MPSNWEIAYDKVKTALLEWWGGVPVFAGKKWYQVILLLFTEVIPDVIEVVEKVSLEVGGLTGDEKKKIASKALNEMIDIPLVPAEFIEAKIFDLAIDAVVAMFNSKFGQAWLEKVKGGE